jgi:outer membrane PBP1 activator LpoA protein
MHPLGHPLLLCRRSDRDPCLLRPAFCAVLLLTFITSCATPPTPVKNPETSGVILGALPAPLEGEQLDLEIIETLSHIARDRSLLAARHYRNETVANGIDASTLMAMDSRLAWYSGDAERASELSRTLANDNSATLAFVREDQEYRAAATGDWLGAAIAVYRQAMADSVPRDTAALSERLFQYLLRTPDVKIREQLDGSNDDPVWRSWLEMQLAYRESRAQFSQWLARNPGSTRSLPIPDHLFEWAQDSQLERLAIILPLDGSLTVAGEAVLAGAVEQLYSLYPNPSNRPSLSTINSADYSSAKDAYQRALDEDPDLILGPLTKSEVASLSELGELPVPTILLNQIDTNTRQGQRNRMSYSLALEDEAMQIADIAFGRGCRNAIVIAAAGDRGNRILTAFEPRWTQLGGKIRGKLVVEQPSQANKAMGELLGSGSSDDRIRAVETAFDLPVDARGRGRSDFECIFMLAPDPTTARAWRPLLVFHMTGDSPVYATSAINDGVSDSRNSDLNGVLFVEVPAMLPPHSSDRLSRLRALGQDALSLAEHWDQTVATDGWIIRGETGVLRRRQNGLIERASELAIFDGAKPRYETLP